MRILVIGRSGQVARALREAAFAAGHDVIVAARPQCDLLRPRTVEAVIVAEKPDIIVNAAAHTAVDAAEDERAMAFALNAEAPTILARMAAERGIPFVHLSTDYVFDGLKGSPYVEEDEPNPINAYGESKLAGERGVLGACPQSLILRTSWVFDSQGRNFVRAVLGRVVAGQPLRVVNDQLGCPTPAEGIAEAIVNLVPEVVAGRATGLLHFCGFPETTWFGFASEIVECAVLCGIARVPLTPIRSEDYPAKALRPKDSRLDCRKAEAFGIVRSDWLLGLHRHVAVMLSNFG